MRRTLVLLGLVAVGIVLVVTIDPPARRSGPELVRGSRVFRTPPVGIRRIDVVLGGRRFGAERVHGGWRLDGVPASPAAAEALDAFATYLAGLRAVDAFRARDLGPFGLASPAGTITITTPRGPQRLALGTLNSAGSALYARRDDRSRVLQIGAYLLSALDRVFAQRKEGEVS